MNQEQLRARQTPLKERYRDEPAAAQQTLRATARLDDGIACAVDTWKGVTRAGLHPATGGDGSDACSGDMLLQALIACAGVTLKAVATSMGITVRSGSIRAEGDIDFRGTCGVTKETPVGFQTIRLQFDLDTDADAEKLQSLLKLTERYCVIYQTLLRPPAITVSYAPIRS